MGTYIKDKQFLENYLKIVELSNGKSKLLLTPSLQGRVMTSSANGDDGYSFGWVNYDLIAAEEKDPHCNNWGGEDRYWLGPEGGQYALFFKNGLDFDYENWHAPALIDTAEWELISVEENRAVFSTERELLNYQNTLLHCRLDREVFLLTEQQIKNIFNITTNLDVVGYTSINTLTNIGKEAWTREKGGLSIWILGQFIPSEKNQIILPVIESAGGEINDIYFGKVDADRLVKKENCYYFKGDGKKRGKIGIPPEMTIPKVFALDEINQVLTIVTFSYDETAVEYINSLWAYQEKPYAGDVINSYNHGSVDGTEVKNGFYEIESSSKALFLSPQEAYTHTSTTVHIKGEITELKKLLADLMKSV